MSNERARLAAPRWPLVGRRAGLDALAIALGDPSCHGALICGPAGVGKTRLAEECLDAMRAGGRMCFRVTASQAAAAVPFGALVHLLPADCAAASATTPSLVVAATTRSSTRPTRVRLNRDLGGGLSMATVETLDVDTAAGNDRVTATRDLPGVTRVDLVNTDGLGDNVLINGTANADSFAVKAGSVAQHHQVSSGSGRPVFDIAGATETRIDAAGGDDIVTSSLAASFTGAIKLGGGASNDTLTSGPKNETVIGGDGNDTLRGGGSLDLLLGENGDDVLFGDAGDDGLFGGPGIDRLDGGQGADSISCGGPGDTIVPDPNDIIGTDCVSGSPTAWSRMSVSSTRRSTWRGNRGQALLTRTEDMPEALAAFKERCALAIGR